MTEDGKNSGNSVTDPLEENMGPYDEEDATVQISGTELAAIRQSATNLELSPEELRQINRRGRQKPQEDDEDDTRTFDRDNLRSMMAETAEQSEKTPADASSDPAMARAAVEEARARADEADASSLADRDDDDVGLDEFSDLDMRAIVFGETSSKGDISEPQPDTASAEPEPEKTDAPNLSDPADITDAADDLEELSDAEFDLLAEELSEATEEEAPPVPESDSAADQNRLDAEQSDANEDQAPAVPAEPAFPELSDEEPVELGSYLGAESLVLLVGGILGGSAMLGVGVLRLVSAEHFSSVHPVMAGMFIAIGFLCLGGALVAVLQRRS